jgi:peptidoglycan-N-acetylglucosamine deacetylase
MLRAVLLLLAATPGAFAAPSPTTPPPQRSIAVTFDDLPGPPGSLLSNAIPALRENTRSLLAALRDAHVPVVGFVNEGKLFVDGEAPSDVAARTDILRNWLDAGHDLGNHGYSHLDLNRVGLDAFEQDVVHGEAVTRGLLTGKGRTLRYFRHPFLHVGLDLEKRRAFEAFLAARGETVAPVTVDNDDYVYASVYADARRRGEGALAQRVADDYVRYMESVLVSVEGVSRALVGREIAQVLLLHASTLNAETFPRLAAMMAARGYRFVTLDQALRDDAYRLPDTYVGPWGISWLHHWEITEGRKRSPSPDPPDWVSQAYAALAP